MKIILQNNLYYCSKVIRIFHDQKSILKKKAAHDQFYNLGYLLRHIIQILNTANIAIDLQIQITTLLKNYNLSDYICNLHTYNIAWSTWDHGTEKAEFVAIKTQFNKQLNFFITDNSTDPKLKKIYDNIYNKGIELLTAISKEEQEQNKAFGKAEEKEKDKTFDYRYHTILLQRTKHLLLHETEPNRLRDQLSDLQSADSYFAERKVRYNKCIKVANHAAHGVPSLTRRIGGILLLF